MADVDSTETPGAETGAPGTLLTDRPADAPQSGENGDRAAANPQDSAHGGKGNLHGAVEAYELAAPEDYPISEGALKELNELCKDNGIPRNHAEAFLEYMHGNYAAAMQNQQTAMQEQAKQWIDDFRADREFGGDRFDASLADARKALATFDAGGVISSMLAQTGYGNNPDVLRIFARVGAALGEDRLIGKSGGAAEKPLWDRLYK